MQGAAKVQVEDVMVHGAVTIDSGASVADAAHLMSSRGVGMLIVTTKEHPVGVVTDRDLLVRCVGEGDMPGTWPIRAYMSTPVISVSPDADLMEAAKLLHTKRIQRLAVERGGVLLGVVSYADISHAMGQMMQGLISTTVQTRRAPNSIEAGRLMHYSRH
jgi:signal-transduction protein with cAMP-binding, CBS, and nucleotidyltransferase domain